MPAANPDPAQPPPTYTPSNQQQVSSKDFEVILEFVTNSDNIFHYLLIHDDVKFT